MKLTYTNMNYVVGFLFDPSFEKVVLIKKTKPHWQLGKYNGVGGKIEENETPHAAMVREFGEETGLYIPEWNQLCTMTSETFPDDTDKWKVHFFWRSGDISQAKTMTEEELGFFYVQALPQNVIDNIKWLIPMALAQKPYSCTYKITEVYE